MSLAGEVEYVPEDLDGKTYYPVTDQNDNLCSLLKVRLDCRLQNELVLSTGGLSVVKRKEQPDGEIWFYVPYQVRNLTFTCKGYSMMDPVPVELKPGAVYRLSITADAAVSTVTSAVASSNYLKMKVYPEDAMISIGKTPDYEMTTEMLDNGIFVRLLDYGTYYYKLEHNLYQTKTGTVNVAAANDIVDVRMESAYNMLTVNSFPDEGAVVVINGEQKGVTPLNLDEKFPKGDYDIRLVHRDYRPEERTVTLDGDGSTIECNVTMTPLYATVTCRSDDNNAEIWVDQEYRGTGVWTGRLSGNVSHVLEARRSGYQSQSKSFSVSAGEVRIEYVGAPVPLYATLNIETEPLMARVRIDGEDVGTSPLIKQVLMGKHSLAVFYNGYVPKYETVTLQHNENRTVRIVLEKDQSGVELQEDMAEKISGYDVEVEEVIEEEAIPFQLVEEKPSFMGGDANEFSKWVNQRLVYPEIAKENGVQGRVTLQFTVESDGRVTNVKVLRGVDSSLDQEAVRVVSSSPRWNPGKQDDRAVRVTYTFPVIFQLR